MAFDRAVTLRNAEKLIRQGKVDAAIAEFVRIVEDQPQDWAAKNTLGDLYSRAGQTDKAVQQLDAADGWEVGGGPSIVVVDEGAAAGLSTRTAKADVYAFTFDQKGLMGGIALEGTKITRLERP